MIGSHCKTLARNGGATILIVSLAVTSHVIADANVLTCVPENVAGFILLSNVEKSDRLLTEFVRKARPDFDGYDLAEFETTAGFAPGTIDLTKPVVIIAERPAELSRLFAGVGISIDDPDWPVIGFTPRDLVRFGKMIDEAGEEANESAIGAVAAPYGRFRILIRDDMVFVSPRRGPLDAIRRATPESSAWSQLNEAARRDASNTDVFVSLSLDRWRNRMQPTILVMSQLIKFGMMMQQKDPARFEETRKLADWFFDGVVSAIDQMKTISVAFSYDGRRFELSHYHTFADDGWMSGYLRMVRRGEDFAPWQSFPDQPFLLAAGVDWRVPAESGLNTIFNRKCMQDPQLCKALPLDERKKLDRDICKLTAATRSQEFFATGDRGTLHPIRIFGSYKVDDPTKALEMQRRVREQMGELMGGLFPGMGDMGTNGNWRIVDGVRVYEAQLMGDDLPKIIRENIAAVYGDDAVFQEAAVDDHTIVYAIDKKDGGVAHLIPIAKKNLPALAVNRSVTNAMALLPSDANVYVLVDVERLALSTPVLIQQGGRMPAAVAKSDEIPPTQIGPLLAWSATVENGGFTGRFAMDGRDVSEAIATVVKVGRRLSGAHIAPETGTVNKN